ncbi:NAD(P)H-dependent oxidoreductase [Bacillus massiliigorillae]|uniref:NAD(P)H-dependent oxidoreductase n=1 Tax=Bacillus massiliigorillae TaxID=1243664 RepID=UPI0003A7E85B|nr:NAD(P)H-dependent oxidoreductase [Bacillus massiliigorillae]
MNHLIVFAHPTANSFNAAIKDSIIKQVKMHKQEFKIRDLYAINFNPILQYNEILDFQDKQYSPDIAFEQQQIQWADVIYFIYPTWWYSMPAILKGYCDRVFAHGFAFTSTPDGPKGLLHGKKAFIFETAGDSEQSLIQRNLKQSMVQVLDVGILQYCGIEVLQHKIMPSIHEIHTNQHEQYLREIEITVQQQINL